MTHSDPREGEQRPADQPPATGTPVESLQPFSGTSPVAARHAVDTAALRAFFSRRIDADTTRFELSQFNGGQSNPTFLVETTAQRFVVRRKPPGTLLPSAHAVDREYRVMAALRGSGVPVPHVLALCEDASVIGTAFYVMEFVAGRVLWDPKLPDLDPVDRMQVCAEMNRVLAALHDVDIEAAGLSDFGRPGHYLARQVGRWTKQYRACETETLETMNRLIDWLPAHLPTASGSGIVHGDYRLDNLVFHATEPRCIAVLDWELSTLGDPLADLAYHCMAWRLAPPFRGLGDLGPGELAALGLPTEAEHVARYCARRGLPAIDPPVWEFYMAFNLFRAAAIAQGIMGRALAGNASSAHSEGAGRQARQLAELGWQQVERTRR